jgi:hypothetical protein
MERLAATGFIAPDDHRFERLTAMPTQMIIARE